ncbi:MAG: methyl-accepting chemotaxis protein [Phycisphaeraceae bacterium]|nr:methyl-accepting chemotaxis protein [Phycisphaeraceae bacterium]
MNTASQELNTAVQELNTASQELNTASQELNTAVQELNTASQELITDVQELNTASQELPTAGQELPTAGQELPRRLPGPEIRVYAAENRVGPSGAGAAARASGFRPARVPHRPTAAYPSRHTGPHRATPAPPQAPSLNAEAERRA